MLPLTQQELHKYLTAITDCDAFELHADTDNIYIPYMMNDALECYLFFSKAHLTGYYLPDFEGETSFEFILESEENNVRNGIIFRQGTNNVFTLWYTVCHRILNCYRYDQIGHFWVNGAEHWRRLVYIIGTIHDKYAYMGDFVCNDQEKALLGLMEFAPFYMYSPIHESLEGIYQDTALGLQTMKSFAVEAGDCRFGFLLQLYRCFPFTWFKKILHRSLNHASRIPLYELIFSKVEQASCIYPPRDYGERYNQQLFCAREALSAKLYEQGFTGQYPLFQKKNRQLLAMEEHPFTILEASDFRFRIQLMESCTADDDQRINAGFFRKKGNHSQILTL